MTAGTSNFGVGASRTDERSKAFLVRQPRPYRLRREAAQEPKRANRRLGGFSSLHGLGDRVSNQAGSRDEAREGSAAPRSKAKG